jgi:ABC-type nitrate/sulfonate/bicarbonate transport system substrate-binding protein
MRNSTPLDGSSGGVGESGQKEAVRMRGGWLALVVCLLAGVVIVFAVTIPPGTFAQVPRLTVGTSVSITLHSLPIIAAVKGFDRAEGIELDIRLFPSGAAMTEAVASGDLAVAQVGDVPFVSMLAAGVPLKLVAQMTDSGRNYSFWMRADAKVRRPEDVLDKTIGFPFGSTSHLIMAQFIKVYGLDARRIKQVDLQPPGVVAAYARGDLDGFILWSPGSNRAARARPSVKIHDAYMSYLLDRPGPRRLGPAHTVVFAREEFLRRNPRLVEAYLRALLRAREFLYSPATSVEAEAIIAEALRVERDIVREALPEIRFQLDIDKRLINDLDMVGRLLAELGRIRAAPEIKKYIDLEPLTRIDRRLVRP